MRAGTGTEVVTEVPVVEIVGALRAGAGVGGHFVLQVACASECVLAELLHPEAQVLVGQPGRRPAAEYRAGLERQLIVRDMSRPQRERGAHVRHRASLVLTRQGIHEVQVEVAQARRMQFLGGGAGVLHAVDASEPLEHGRRETLRAQRYAVDAGGAVVGEAAALDGPRIRFQRDLGGGGQRQAAAQPVEQPRQRGRLEQARRAAAQEDAGDRAPGNSGQLRVQILEQGVEVGRLRQVPVQGVRIEIAVRALAHTPGEVQVERQGRCDQRHESSLATSSRRALPRWLSAFLRAGLSSAAVQSKPAGMKQES